MDKSELLKKYISSKYLGFPISTELFSTALIIGTQLQLFREICLGIYNKNDKFEYKPAIGADIKFTVDYEKSEIEIERLQKKECINLINFCKLLSLLDSICMPIYPLGSVVELDEALLPKEVIEVLEKSEFGFLVTLQGRKIPVEQTNIIIDYIGTIWPLGLLPRIEPILIHNFMIKRLVYSGLSNETEKKYTSYLRNQQLRMNQQSGLFKNLESDLKRGKSDEN